VAAFGTSSPELLVAIHAALDGVPQISLGDVLGSNVVNISLVLAIVVALSGMKAEDDGVRRDWAVAVLVPGVVYLLLMDGWFSRIDAAVMMLGFVLWLLAVIRHARRHAANTEAAVEPVSPLKTGFAIVMGLALLIVAAQLVVHGGKGVAECAGLEPVRRRRGGGGRGHEHTGAGHHAHRPHARPSRCGLGNILGSNIFNVLFIAAVAAMIRPYAVKLPEMLPSLAFGVITMLLILPGKGGHLGRWRGSGCCWSFTPSGAHR
jgi:cation:H+ antiporter